MRKFFLGGTAALVLLAAPAQAAPVKHGLSVRQAHRAVSRWSTNNGATRHKIQRCRRQSATTIRCTIRESGWSAEDSGIPCDDCVAEDVWSVVLAKKHRDGHVGVRWLDFVWG